MIAFVSGTLEQVGEDAVVVDVGGVGYEVTVSQDTIARLPSIGEQVKLYTYFQVSQDMQRLYGFLSRDGLAMFRRLIAVSGLGPRGGQAILSVMTPDELRFAILTGNSKAITAAPGVGKKIADRIILELKDKFSNEELTTGGDAPEALVLSKDDPGKDAIEALIALGYGGTEAMRAVRAALGKDAGADTETLLKAALKELM